MNDHEQGPTPERDDTEGAAPAAPVSEQGVAPHGYGANPPAWGSPPPFPAQPPYQPAPWAAAESGPPAWVRPTYEPGPRPGYVAPGDVGGGPVPPAGSSPWSDGRYDPRSPGGAPPHGPGGGAPPYGGWAYGPPGSDPWGPRQPEHVQPNRATRRRRAAAAGATAGFLLVAGAGVIIGHATWPGSSTRAAASAPVRGSLGAGSTGTGSTGTGSTGTGSTGTGSTGTGSTGTGSSGLGSGSTGSGGFGSGTFGGSGSTSSAATSSIAAGGPTNSAALAKAADAGLVDIDTALGYQDAAAAGTGMVLTSTGEILTNNHVIDGATSIRVTDIGNGKTYTASVVGYDRTQDVAVLQLKNASGLQTVTLGNSSAVKVSQAVVGVGNAGGVGGTPTYAGGAVQSVSKSITASDEGDGDNSEHLTGLLETNAGIEAGDSGGPLLDTAGQVIGMDTAALSGTSFQAATTSQSYAIPINEAVTIARQIESGSDTSLIHIGATALLGVEVSGSGASSGESGSAGTASGATIAEVVPSSSAAQAGLVAGDTITAVNGHAVSSASALTNDLTTARPGQTVQITYVASSGSQSTVAVDLGSGPPQ